MTASTSATTGETWKIYRPNPSLKIGSIVGGGWIFTVMLLMPAIAMLGEYRQSGRVSGAWIGIVLMLAFVLIAGRRALKRDTGIYLAVSSAGIEFYTPDLVIKTSWDNVKELRLGHSPTLVLQRRAATYISILYRRDWTTGKHIPLAWFDYDSHSALAADIRAFAPQLFTAAPAHSTRR